MVNKLAVLHSGMELPAIGIKIPCVGAFQKASPMLCNKLSQELRTTTHLITFHSKCKAYFFPLIFSILTI